MKINFKPYKVEFTSNSIPKLPEEGIIMGYDDLISSTKRKSIREHIEKQTGITYFDYYEMPKSDYEMEQMLKSWGLKIDHHAKEIIVPPYLNVIYLGNNNCRGALPHSFSNYKDLKKSGITTVICATPCSNIRDSVERNGIEYIELVANNPIHNLFGKDYIFEDFAFNEEDDYIYELEKDYEDYSKYEEDFAKKFSDKEFVENKRNEFRTRSRKFIEELIKAVCEWQKGCCFIGCEFGTNMTSNALSVIDAFNPKGDGIDSSYLTNMEMNCIGNLYRKLTPQDKKLMGWTEEFETSFKERFLN